jgi:hypothetical protein
MANSETSSQPFDRVFVDKRDTKTPGAASKDAPSGGAGSFEPTAYRYEQADLKPSISSVDGESAADNTGKAAESPSEPKRRSRALVHVATDFTEERKLHMKCCPFLCGRINRKRACDYPCWYWLCPTSVKKPFVISVPIRSIDALISSEKNVFGFLEIDSDLREFFIDKCKESLFSNQAVELHLYTSDPEDLRRLAEVSTAIGNSFRFEGRKAHSLMQGIVYEGLNATFLGLIMSTLCIGLIIGLYFAIQDARWSQLVSQILVIVIWVSVWNPVDLLVFGRYQTRQRCKICKALAEARISIRLLGEGSSNKLDVFDVVYSPEATMDLV